MSQFYLRKARLVMKRNGRPSHIVNPGDDTNQQIQIDFSVSKSLSSTANTASIKIWNLSESTRNAMGRELDEVELEAGYIPPDGGSNIGTIFAGALRDVEHRREQDDVVTYIECGDGDRAFRHATLSKSYAAGTPVKTVVEDLRDEFGRHGVAKGEVKGLDDLPAFERPYSMCGYCDREMDRLARRGNFYWSVQNGVFETVPGNGTLGGITLLTPRTGLIGTPTITDNGVKVDALLNPQIRPGRKVRIESDTLEMNAEDGTYRIGNVEFQGNNRDGDFRVSIHAESLQAKKVDEGVNVPIPTPRLAR